MRRASGGAWVTVSRDTPRTSRGIGDSMKKRWALISMAHGDPGGSRNEPLPAARHRAQPTGDPGGAEQAHRAGEQGREEPSEPG